MEFWEMRVATSTLIDIDLDAKTADHSCTVVPVAGIEEMKSTEFQKLSNEGLSWPLRTCGLKVAQCQKKDSEYLSYHYSILINS
jgi:hypothetical protein